MCFCRLSTLRGGWLGSVAGAFDSVDKPAGSP
jgi:hypothetical protein